MREIARKLSRVHATIGDVLRRNNVNINDPLLREIKKKNHSVNVSCKISNTKTTDYRRSAAMCVKCLVSIGFGRRNIEKIMGLKNGTAANIMKKEKLKMPPTNYRHYRYSTPKREAMRKNQIIARNLRTRLRDALRTIGQKKRNSTRNLIGCSLMQFRQHIEKQFTKRMSWSNYGKNWHLDHIVPCAKFDLQNPEHLKICFHFTNYRPLNARRNMSENSRKKINQQLPLPL